MTSMTSEIKEFYKRIDTWLIGAKLTIDDKELSDEEKLNYLKLMVNSMIRMIDKLENE